MKRFHVHVSVDDLEANIRFYSAVFGVKPTDPMVFVSVAVLLGSVAFLASYIPARRAVSISPSVALRYE